MRAFPKTPKLKRIIETVQPKVEIIIFCEGKNTEPAYFKACVDYYGAGLVSLRTIPAAGVPLTLVRAASKERSKLISIANRSRNSFDRCFRVWAVFDRDEHPDIQTALSEAQENNIDIAFSNPCFELWPVLHQSDHGTQDGRHAVQKRLSELMPNYDHENGATIDFTLIKDNFKIAYQRAEILNKQRENENCPFGTPSTTAGSLVIKIIQNGKKGSLHSHHELAAQT